VRFEKSQRFVNRSCTVNERDRTTVSEIAWTSSQISKSRRKNQKKEVTGDLNKVKNVDNEKSTAVAAGSIGNGSRHGSILKTEKMVHSDLARRGRRRLHDEHGFSR
jgi:hypothetical protein